VQSAACTTQNQSRSISHERHDATPRRLAHSVARTASIALLCRHKQVEAHETVLVSGDDVSCLYIVLLGIINERSGDACCETTKQAPVPCVVRTSSPHVVRRALRAVHVVVWHDCQLCDVLPIVRSFARRSAPARLVRAAALLASAGRLSDDPQHRTTPQLVRRPLPSLAWPGLARRLWSLTLMR